MERLTIHTATYNRAYILSQAYESLKKQTCKDFEWIISDDGSTDGTRDMVKEWLEQDNGFIIRYNPLKHVGIPRALNSGVSLANTEWFMMLDSDDYIVPETVELVLSWLDEIKNVKMICGVGFAKCFPNGDYMKPHIPIIDSDLGYVDASHIERKKYNLDMDMCEVHRTAMLKQYPFQVFKDEKYAPERLNYYSMALDGWKMRWRDNRLYVCDYLPDGQTKSDTLVKKNPMGYAMMYNQNFLFHKGLKLHLFDAIQMVALCLYAGHVEYLKKSNNKIITAIAFPMGIVLSIRRKCQYAKMK